MIERTQRWLQGLCSEQNQAWSCHLLRSGILGEPDFSRGNQEFDFDLV